MDLKRFNVIKLIDAPERFYGAGKVAVCGMQFFSKKNMRFFSAKFSVVTLGIWDREDIENCIKKQGFILPS